MLGKRKKMVCGRNCILSMVAIVLFDMIGVGIVIPVVAVLVLEPGTGLLPAAYPLASRLLLYGVIIALYPLAQFFGAPILGGLSDRYGRKKILLISLAGTFVGYVMFGLGITTGSLLLLFAGRIIDGVTGGNISVALAAISDVSDEKSKARNFGLIGMAFGFGFVIGPFIGGQLSNPGLVSWFNYATPFWFAAGLTVFNIVLLLAIFPETLLHRTKTRISVLTGVRNIRKAFTFPNLRVVLLVVFLLTFGFSFFVQFMQVLLIERFSFNQVDIGNYLAYIGLWIAFTQGFVTRMVSRRFSPPKVIRYSVFLLGLTLPLLLVPREAIYLFLIAPFVAIFQGLTYPNSTAIVSNLTDDESQGEIMGINQSLQSLAQAIPPIIAGFIAYLDPSLPVLVASFFTFVAWIIFMAFFREKRKGVFHEV